MKLRKRRKRRCDQRRYMEKSNVKIKEEYRIKIERLNMQKK